MEAEGWNQEGSNHRGQQGRGDVEGDKIGANGRGKRQQKLARGAGLQGMRQTLGSRSRAVNKKSQRRVVKDGRSGCFSRCTGNPRSEEKG